MSNLTPISIESSPISHEETYVHAIYEEIASHFSQTRYKPWPLIAKFLASIEAGSIGLDSGTGNGKYLPLDQGGRVCIVGMDRSKSLLQFAQRAGNKYRDVVWGDALGLGWRRGSFDFAISIATIHHFSTEERRCEAIVALIFALKPNGGRLLTYVWAVEQDQLSKRVVPISDPDNTRGQDVLVPWVLATSEGSVPSPSPTKEQPFRTKILHMFASSELRQLVCRAASRLNLQVGTPPVPSENFKSAKGLEIVQEGWERSNYYLEARLWQS
ncbi:S-adenosyl-L-methionine-dependent methyltransferase [Cantharellus anzutake]|uniref:S-adenosyl-L-methionine-dependent methyltransferase n=1 Tax=Cantharellus anzutake TaxID=1750568 RepID=UPI001908F5A6